MQPYIEPLKLYKFKLETYNVHILYTSSPEDREKRKTRICDFTDFISSKHKNSKAKFIYL
jgi:hypothetical protein